LVRSEQLIPRAHPKVNRVLIAPARYAVTAILVLRLDSGAVGMWWGMLAGLGTVSVVLAGRFWRLSGRRIEVFV
jgi:hypothetical protein